MALDKFRDPADPLWELRVNQLEEGTGVGEVTTAKIGANQVTGAKTAAAVLGRRVLLSAQAIFIAAEGTGTYFPVDTGNKPEKATTLKVEYATTMTPFIALIPSQWEVAGRTSKVAVKLDLTTNAKAAGSAFIAGLYELEKTAGATGKTAITYKAVLSGTTAEIAAPAIETFKTATSTSVAFPAEGTYALGVEVATEALKVESQVYLSAQLVLLYS